MHSMLPARFRRIALAGCALLGACNDTRDLAPASPDTPRQFQPSKEAPATPESAVVAARQFAVPENTAVQFPSPADVDPNHAFSVAAACFPVDAPVAAVRAAPEGLADAQVVQQSA